MRPKICRTDVSSALRNMQPTMKRMAPMLTSPAATCAVASGMMRLSCAPKRLTRVARPTQTQGTLTLVISTAKDFHFVCSCWFYIVRHEKTSQSCYFAQIDPHKQRLGCIQSHSKAAAAPRQCPLRIPQVWLSMLHIFRNILQSAPQAQIHKAQIAKNPCISHFNVV